VELDALGGALDVGRRASNQLSHLGIRCLDSAWIVDRNGWRD
jgi:hypothetical protein